MDAGFSYARSQDWVHDMRLTSSYQSHKYDKNEVTNLCGNSKKSMHVSIRESLRKLQTDYVRLSMFDRFRS